MEKTEVFVFTKNPAATREQVSANLCSIDYLTAPSIKCYFLVWSVMIMFPELYTEFLGQNDWLFYRKFCTFVLMLNHFQSIMCNTFHTAAHCVRDDEQKDECALPGRGI